MRFPLINPEADPAAPIVASDLEGTLSRGVTVRGIHQHLERTGRRRTSRSSYFRRVFGFVVRKATRRDLRAYTNDWMRDVMAGYGGQPIGAVKEMADWVVEHITLSGQRPEVVAELQAHIAQGRRVIVVSGVADFFLESLLVHFPGMEGLGTTPYVENGAFTGRLGTFNVGSRKVKNLRAIIGSTGRLFGAYGDTFSDMAMLEMAEDPVAVHPDRRLHEAARARGWRVLGKDS